LSHIVEIKTEVRDPAAVTAACERMKLEPPVHGTTRLFSGEATGLIVNLPGWRFPAVFDTATGEARYDNFHGRWGAHTQLERFLQCYAAEKVKIESRRQGHSVTEQSLEDGSIKLTVHVGEQS
jgi:hypothetical protein